MSKEPVGSTYRMQLAGIGFAGAREQVAYLHELGIETLYVSPILAAVPGSKHGYDVIDPGRIDPELGTVEELEDLLAELDSYGMRLLVDFVPNHMAAHPANRLWWEVMRDGRRSEHASVFDIDWSRHGGRVLVPTLSRPIAELRDEARVVSGDDGSLLELDGQYFPLARHSEATRDTGALIDEQHYRPSFWRLSRHEGNYRRFFDVDGLIGVRVEDPAVFELTHLLIVEMCTDRRVAGVRVDHIDGLSDPAGYTRRLSAALEGGARSPIVLVEKILANDEALPTDWPVHGTTGYEFANFAGGLFVDAKGARSLAELGAELTGESQDFAELSLQAKRDVLALSFPAPLERLGRLAIAALDADEPGHDLSLADVCEALEEITVRLDVYRTYLDDKRPRPADRARLERACAAAEVSSEARRAIELLQQRVLERTRANSAWLEVAQRFQQLTVAVMAKGVEDTASYRYSGLASQAEVGCDPDLPSADSDDLERLALSHRRRNCSLNATSTHDSKRNEDARARLYVISEAFAQWSALVRRWHGRRIRAESAGPDVHDELLAYQTLLALWPFDGGSLPKADRARAESYALKAAREAKRRTGWLNPDPTYEQAVTGFITRLARDHRFTKEMGRFVTRIGPAAATNSLALTVLKTVFPGVPDFYQGTELFEPALTDPDNRRPVDYLRRRELLRGLPPVDAPPAERALAAGALLREWANGRVKLFTIRALLQFRRAEPQLFDKGTYELLEVTGDHKGHLVAFARRHRRSLVVALVPRLMLEIAGAGKFPTDARVWGGTVVMVPGAAPSHLTDVLTGKTVPLSRGRLKVRDALDPLPVSVLTHSM
ncbi:MAG: malto-oligosyltrehalose synthase [Acidimicrobiales bacterium]|jgi:(1->4)-alpha-D-glucan 1-alpha-D-glucosylmutase